MKNIKYLLLKLLFLSFLFVPFISYATTPESCFVFDAAINSITNYNETSPWCGTEVDIPSTIWWVSVIKIWTGAFLGKQLTSINFPNSITEIWIWAFQTNQLTSLNLSNSITEIWRAAFQGNLLSSLNLPNSITFMWEWAFRANKLTSLTLSESITYISNSTFRDNELTSVRFWNSFTTIYPSAFMNNKLKYVVIPSTLAYIDNGVFFDNPSSQDPSRVKLVCDWYTVSPTIRASNSVLHESCTTWIAPYKVIINPSSNWLVGSNLTYPLVSWELVTLTTNPDAWYKLWSLTISWATLNEVVDPNLNTYTFIVWSWDVTVNAEFELISYNITINPAINWTISWNKTQAGSWETVELTITPNAWYKLKPWTLKVLQGSTEISVNWENKFNMPWWDVIVKAEFELISYNITINPTINWTISWNKTQAGSWETVELTITPNAWYKLKPWTLKVLQGSTEISVNWENKFNMPWWDVIVKAEFEIVSSSYDITINSTINWTISWDKTQASSWEIIKLTITPNTWYKLKPWTLKVLQGSTEISVNWENKFNMPWWDVIVKAEFEFDVSNFPSWSSSSTSDWWKLIQKNCVEEDYVCVTKNWKNIYELKPNLKCYDKLAKLWNLCEIKNIQTWKTNSWTENLLPSTWDNNLIEDSLNIQFPADNNIDTINAKLFIDIDKSFAKKYIEELWKKWILKWYTGSLYKPENKITRWEFLAVIMRWLKINLETQIQNKFTDISTEEEWMNKYINKALELWIINWQTVNGKLIFRPNEDISRIEALSILLKAWKVDLTTDNKLKYEDNDFEEWMKKYVIKWDELWIINWQAVNNKLIFRPNDNITRAETSKIIYKFTN